MELQEIATEDYQVVEPDTRAGTVRSTLEQDQTAAVLVVGDEILGAVLPRELLQSRVSDDAAAHTVATAVPKLEWGTNVREIARLLVENETTVAPVVDEGGHHGVVTRDSLLRAIDADLSTIRVADIQTRAPVTVGRDEQMGTVINTLRENSISRLPVIDDGKLVGIATTSDLLEFVVRGTETVSTGDRGGEKQELLDIPVENVMSRPAETTDPDETVDTALDTMFEQNDDGLVVTNDSDNVVGVLTKTDVLRALTYTADSHLDVQVTNLTLLQQSDRTDVAERIEAVLQRDQQLDVIHADVTFQQHDEQHRGESLIRAEVRLFTDETQLAGTGEEYGAENALTVALEKLERNVLERKQRRTDDGQHRPQTDHQLENNE